MVTVDTVAPEASPDALAAYRNQGAIHLSWSGHDPAPGAGVVSYDVQHRLGSGAWQTVLAGTTAVEHTFIAAGEGRHAFRVRARDGAGNAGAYSTPVWTVFDASEPTVELALGEDGAYAHVSGSTVYYGAASGSFDLQVALVDPVPAPEAAAGLAEVVLPATTGPGATYALDGVVEWTRNQEYAFDAASSYSDPATVAVTDRAGNAATATFEVVRDDEAPEIALSVPGWVYGDTVSISWVATDTLSGVARYDLEMRVDGGPWQAVLAGSTATGHRFTGLEGSVFEFRVTATDRVGNVSTAEATCGLAAVTKYYYHGGQRVAMRKDGALTYLHGDHLGSTSLTTDADGQKVARVLYYPYGEERYVEGTLQTDYQFTGQRREEGIGLYDYNARYYDPYLNRFISPDIIVSDPANPQGLNRFAYALDNPLRYVDPTGHFTWDQTAEFLGWGPKHVLPSHAYYPDTGNGTDAVIISAGAHLKAAYENGDIKDERLLATIDMLLEAEFGDVVLAGSGTDSSTGYAADALMFVASEFDENDASIMLWSFGKGEFTGKSEIEQYSKWQLYKNYRGPLDKMVSPYSSSSISYNEAGGSCNYNVKNMIGIATPIGFPHENGLWVTSGYGMDLSGLAAFAGVVGDVARGKPSGLFTALA